MLRARDIASLAGLGQFQDREYSDPEIRENLVLRQIACLFKKNDAFSDDTRCSQAATETFVRGELRCRLTNKRIYHYSEHQERLSPELQKIVTRMQREIAALLGDVNDFVERIPDLVRLTNGATEDRTRVRSLPFLKISGKLKGPIASVRYMGDLLLHYGVDLANCVYEIVERNVLNFVPKNWSTHRTIAKEPTHSLPFQLALDGFLKGKLRKWSVNLLDQSPNQELARLGSLDGSFATIDLEMASDTLSFNTVAWLLPSEWFALLCAFRSRYYSAPWGSGRYAKFSSMGNGYTFSLETLIFTALCRAVGSRQYAVYGDDIVIETDRAPSLVRTLRFFGFRTNGAKSFTNPHSRFRESCGCDYYKGKLVTPFYLRECPKLSDAASMSHVLNGLIEAVGVPGHSWSWYLQLVVQRGYRLVPWNSDTRSGVFISPHLAWQTKKLYVDRRRTITSWVVVKDLTTDDDGFDHLVKRRVRMNVENKDFGFPMFSGYGLETQRRKTFGWRSLLLWFCEKNYGGERAYLTPNRHSELLLSKRGDDDTDGTTATVTSYVATKARFIRKVNRYFPQPQLTPSHLYLFDEAVRGTVLPRKPENG